MSDTDLLQLARENLAKVTDRVVDTRELEAVTSVATAQALIDIAKSLRTLVDEQVQAGVSKPTPGQIRGIGTESRGGV